MTTAIEEIRNWMRSCPLDYNGHIQRYNKLLAFEKKYTFCKAFGKYHEDGGYCPTHLILKIEDSFFMVTYLDGVFSMGDVIEITKEEAYRIKDEWSN